LIVTEPLTVLQQETHPPNGDSDWAPSTPQPDLDGAGVGFEVRTESVPERADTPPGLEFLPLTQHKLPPPSIAIENLPAVPRIQPPPPPSVIDITQPASPSEDITLTARAAVAQIFTAENLWRSWDDLDSDEELACPRVRKAPPKNYKSYDAHWTEWDDLDAAEQRMLMCC